MTEPRAPRLAADLPGCGGAPREPEDFVVEEIPAYLPAGEGDHCLALVEKRGMTTPAAIVAICRALDLAPGAAGAAGLKDRHAVTRQWISFAGADPTRLRGLALPGLRIVEAARHPNKLRTGHLRGNRFTIRLREVGEAAASRAGAIAERLAATGLPNYFGPQRFGAHGDNAARGHAMLRGDARGPRAPRERRLVISALQSALFNEVLARRVTGGATGRLLGGEVLQRLPGRGLFTSEDLGVDQARLDAGEVVITGPIPGPRMPRPAAGSPARDAEDAIFARVGIAPDDLRRFRRLARGGRRALVVRPEGLRVEEAAGGLVLSFALPRGSYATALLAEVTGDPRFSPPGRPLDVPPPPP